MAKIPKGLATIASNSGNARIDSTVSMGVTAHINVAG
jgi:hypothetical protein